MSTGTRAGRLREDEAIALAVCREVGIPGETAWAGMQGLPHDPGALQVGRLTLVVGSRGGSGIIGYVLKTLVAVLDWGLDIQAAIDLPNVGNRNGPTELEQGTAAETLKPGLETLGHEVRVLVLTSGLHGIAVTPTGLVGGADPRREGIALGD